MGDPPALIPAVPPAPILVRTGADAVRSVLAAAYQRAGRSEQTEPHCHERSDL